MENTETEDKTKGAAVKVIVSGEGDANGESVVKPQLVSEPAVVEPQVVKEAPEMPKQEPEDPVKVQVNETSAAAPTVDVVKAPEPQVISDMKKPTDSNSMTDSSVAAETKEEPAEIKTEQVSSDQPSESEGLASVRSMPEENSNGDKEDMAEAAPQATVGVAASQMGKSSDPHRNNRKLAAIVIVAVALLLSAIAVYVYMSTDKNTKSTSSNAASQAGLTAETPLVPVTQADVDQAAAEVDEVLNGLNEDTDFSEDSLSDTTLGL